MQEDPVIVNRECGVG